MSTLPLLLSSSLAFTPLPESSPVDHQTLVSSSAFWCQHWEGGIRRESIGAAIALHLEPTSGFGLCSQVKTGLDHSPEFWEGSTKISYYMPTDSFQFYPFLSGRYLRIESGFRQTDDPWLCKGTLYGGMGLTWKADPSFQIGLEVSAFRDVKNRLLFIFEDSFQGRSYSNPWGGKGLVRMGGYMGKKCFLNLEGYYAAATEMKYIEKGSQLSFGWRF